MSRDSFARIRASAVVLSAVVYLILAACVAVVLLMGYLGQRRDLLWIGCVLAAAWCAIVFFGDPPRLFGVRHWIAAIISRRARHRELRGCCVFCGYRRGFIAPETPCPECGKLPPAEVAARTVRPDRPCRITVRIPVSRSRHDLVPEELADRLLRAIRSVDATASIDREIDLKARRLILRVTGVRADLLVPSAREALKEMAPHLPRGWTARARTDGMDEDQLIAHS